MLEINMEFWIGLSLVALAVLLMNLVCWGIKPVVDCHDDM